MVQSRKLALAKQIYAVGLSTVWQDGSKTEEDTIRALLSPKDDLDDESKKKDWNPLVPDYDKETDERFKVRGT